MKKGIHPEYVDCTVRCGCGETWQTRSTVPEIKIEICSACHPFFQGGSETKFVDTLGRVDRFTKKFGSDYFKSAEKTRKSKTQRR
jgi:large subunit ribosomal protein L31